MLFLYLFCVFFLSAFSCWALSRLAPKLKLLALPGEHRAHEDPTPMVGGLAIYIALTFGLLLDSGYKSFLPCLFLLCAVGALDDRYALPSVVRFIAQGLAAYLMILLTGVSLLDLGYLFSFDNKVLLGSWSTPMTIFAVIGVINAVNMSVGIDGLAGSLVFLVLTAFLLIGNPNQGLILISLAAIGGFLFWNLRLGRLSAHVFMGDAGSTMLGLLLAYLLIQHSQFTDGIWPVTALWLLALPLIDAVAVLLVRPLRGASPFTADRIHYHHQLIDRGVSVNGTLAIALVLQGLLIAFGVFLLQMRVADHIQLAIFLSVFVCYFVSLLWFTRGGKRL